MTEPYGLTNLLSFLIGLSTAFYTIFSLHILFFRKNRTRFQTVLGIILAIWAVSTVKDLVITFPGRYVSDVLNWILLIDGWSAITYTVFVFEVTMPGWTTLRKLLLLALPFFLFTVAYALLRREEIVEAYSLFLWCYGWAVVFIGYVRSRKYLGYVRNNFSEIDTIDVSWLRPVFFFAIVSQLLWLFTSLYADMLTDILYYISTIILWLMVLKYSWNFHPIITREETVPLSNRPLLAKGVVERVVEEQRLYLKKGITLYDVAQALNTNRTYVSRYMSQVRGQTFYDYINQLRIERVSLPMMQEHPEYKLEHVAEKSGFGCVSTFRRAFVKYTGQMPGQGMTVHEGAN